MDKLQKSEHDVELTQAKQDRLNVLASRKKAERHKIVIPKGDGFLKKPEQHQLPKTDKERIAELEAQVAELIKIRGG